MSPSPQITFLGTGSAFPMQSFNTCLVLDDGDLRLLVDAGGGNGIVNRLKEANIDIRTITDLFITHTHTDHILGAVWVVRAVINAHKAGQYAGQLHIYANSEVIDALDTICRLTLLPTHYELMRSLTQYINVEENPIQEIKHLNFQFFDVSSIGVCQTGFSVVLSNGERLVCLGDESLTDRNRIMSEGADWLICGAFCRHKDADIFKPYEKHHHTVADVARQAQLARIKKLILVHAEDSDISCREQLFANEAASVYDGEVLVPKDGTTLKISN